MPRVLCLLFFATATFAWQPLVRNEKHHDGAWNTTEFIPGLQSYYTADWEDPENAPQRHPGLIFMHALLMCLAFFLFLPIGIALRSVKHPLHGAAVCAQWVCVAFALACGSVYKKLTPDMYPGESHSSHGCIILLIAFAVTLVDAGATIRHVIRFVQAKKYTLEGFRQAVASCGDSVTLSKRSEYISLSENESDTDTDARYQYDGHGTPSRSDETLNEDHPPSRTSLFPRLVRGTLAISEWLLLFAAFAMLLSGIAIYFGGCKNRYLNGCLAHFIKGGIFWAYGLLNFARYLGFCSALGWAWNRVPASYASRYPTAEFVESFVVFLYGATNTWMERFSARPGDPYTTKQIEHIGIAVMFWFAGLLGMAVESKSIRRWLTALGTSSQADAEPARDADSLSNTGTASLNPFPALVIGITGAVMGSHTQKHLFEVQIHALWGGLILGFAVLRCATYFCLWLRPIAAYSTRPSHPPTEALAAFSMAAGGVSMMLSVEDVTTGAIRRGRDDIMLFAVLAVSSTCIAFCWTVGVVAFAGWLRTRVAKKLDLAARA